ncbi:hypothetical protein HPB52_020397 [Rhipicephalus sanguineus]|uniref:UDENN FLCN/SMCR8-type domain-containing protein n=1 Tax=Rhipicephalus sanguineus TaxID=34632 RepID=A0A9D4PNS6_RHISA|nr:hypothetical protein HPB52_020397 [Rhipicephalus sanguineus]
MLGHRSEARAYVNRDEEAQQHADVFLDFDDDPVSKQAIQHDWSGMLFSQEENPFVDEDNDFILIAECNEVHGPMPLVTIPHNIGDRVENIDINSLVISILSVDYQQVGASSTFPKLDSQILMPSIRDDLHILVNYSVMLDPKARGFVRPMCIAYASSDKGKLVKHARYIRSALIEASLALKLYNIKYFVQGIRNLLKDVKYTRRLNVGCGQRLDKLNGSSISEASFHESLNKYEDMLESALQEIEDSLAAGCPFDASATEHARRIKCQAKDLVRHLLNLPRLSPELERFLQFATEKEPPHEPRELKIPFQRDYEHGLVPLRDIWKKGFILCIYWLYVSYKFFRRRAESVAVCLQQEKPLSSLRYGACLRSTDSTRASASSLVSNGHVSSHDKCSRSSQPMCIYYRLAHPECLPFEKAASGKWDVDSGFLDCFSHLHLEKGFSRAKVTQDTDYMERHGLTLEKQWDAMQTCVHDGSEAIFLQVLNRRVKVEDILYSLLIGRPIVVVGRPLSAHEVAASAKVLALFAPRRFGDFLWFEDQRFDSLDSSCLNSAAVIGYVDEHQTKDFGLPSSVRGVLLKQTSQRIRLLEENEALLAVISSVLADVEYVAHTWVQLTTSARKTESKAFAKQKQLTTCDMTILKHYEKLMSEVHSKK